LLRNKNGYMVTGYYKDGMIRADGDEEWMQPIVWHSFLLLKDLDTKLIAAAPELLKRANDLLDSVLKIYQYNKGVFTGRDIKRIEKLAEAIKATN